MDVVLLEVLCVSGGDLLDTAENHLERPECVFGFLSSSLSLLLFVGFKLLEAFGFFSGAPLGLESLPAGKKTQ